MAERGSYDPANEADRILAAVVEASDDAITGYDLNGRIVAWNRGAERLYGHAAVEVMGRSIGLVVPPERSDELPRILQQIRRGARVEPYETVRVAKDGRRLDVLLTVTPITNADGQIVGAAGLARDVTASKQNELALKTTEARWRSIVEYAVDGIIVIDARGRIEAFNPAAERLFGYREAEVLGQNVTCLMPSPYREEHDGYIDRYLQTGEQKIIGIGREVTGLRRDGTTFPVHLAVGEMVVGGERKFTGILHDLSARVRIEERLREQTAMARLGEMAAVVAHEVKNPLAGIRGAIQVIGSRLPAGSRDAAVVKEIITRIDGLNDLMKDLLLFARPPQPRLAHLDLGALVAATVALLSQDPALAGVRVDVQGAAPFIDADPELVKIALSNLIVNSAHAMAGQGSIRVSLEASAGYANLVIADSGPGMTPEVRAKIFTPFFTTKARGTGLGLSTAKRIVEAHGGTIAIDCPVSGGTIVTMRFPAERTLAV